MARKELPLIFPLSYPEALGKSLCSTVFSGIGQQQPEYSRINCNIEIVFSLSFNFLNVLNPLSDDMKNPGLLCESVAEQPAVAGVYQQLCE